MNLPFNGFLEPGTKFENNLLKIIYFKKNTKQENLIQTCLNSYYVHHKGIEKKKEIIISFFFDIHIN